MTKDTPRPSRTRWLPFGLAVLFWWGAFASGHAADDPARLQPLNAYWREVARAVREGDFEGYRATCHDEGVLVSGAKNTSYPLTTALPTPPPPTPKGNPRP